MINHIVCFKLKDSTEENCLKAKEVLMGMKENVPMVRDISVGIDFLHSARSYDIILQVKLDSREILDAYQNDTYHVDVVKKYMHQVVSNSIAVDFDLE